MVTHWSGAVNLEHMGLACNFATAWIMLFSFNGSSFPSRTTCKEASSAIAIVAGVHGKPVLEDPAIDFLLTDYLRSVSASKHGSMNI